MKNFAVKYDNLETKVGRYLQQKHMPLFNNLVGQSTLGPILSYPYQEIPLWKK